MENSLNNRLKFIFLATLVLIFGVSFLWLWYDWVVQKDVDVSIEQTSEFNLTGTLLISYAAKSDAYNGTRIVPAVYSSVSPQIMYVPVDQLVGEAFNTVMAYHHTHSNGGQFVAFTVAQGLPTDSTPASLGMVAHQIYRADLSDVFSEEEVVSKLQNSSAITSGDSVKLFPSISDSGEVLFMSHKPGDTNEVFTESEAEDWEVQSVATDGSVTTLAIGVQPKWLDQDSFVYLKNDGIYLHSISEGDDRPLFTTNVLVNVHNRLDVSADGKRLVWSSPSIGAVRVFEIIIGQEGETSLQEIDAIDSTAGSVVFSPDGLLLALQTAYLNTDKPDEPLNALVFYDLVNKEWRGSPVLSPNVDLNFTDITDWVN